MTVDYRTGEITEPLTTDEQARLRVKERAIERGADEVARALSTIRDERLYRAEHATFEDYCRERWGMTHRHVNRQIVAAEVAEAMGPMGPTLTERQSRELADLRDDPAQMREVYRQASEATDGKPTAAAIRAVRTPQTPEPAEEGEAGAGSGQTPEGEAGVVPASPVEHVTETPRSPVTGLDGKTYSRPTPRPLVSVNEDEWNEQDRAEELARNLARNLSLLYAVTDPERRADYIATWRAGTKSVQPLGHEFIDPQHMRDLSIALNTFADEWEHADV